jgi:hypothetical protein
MGFSMDFTYLKQGGTDLRVPWLNHKFGNDVLITKQCRQGFGKQFQTFALLRG